MEGYLYKKGRGDSSFGRRNWKKRWFVLERQNLMYYEELDLTTGNPVSLRDTINIAGCTCSHFKHHEKKHTFSIKLPGDNREIILQTLDGRSMNAWIKEISTAARGENLFDEVNYPACYEVLGLSMNDDPTPQDINRAYRKMALKCHPDKGGDLIEFKKVQDSFNNIMNKITSDENDKLFNIFEYEVVLLKSPGDAGLGLAVREDAQTRRIHIKDVLPDMKIQSISPVSGGSIKINDILVAVRNESTRGMPLMRVAQKLNDFRVPVYSTVQLTFERRERKDGAGEGKVGDQEDDIDDDDEDDEEEEDEEDDDDEEEDEAEDSDKAEDIDIPKNEQKATEQASPPNIQRARTVSAMEDIDDDEPNNPPPPAAAPSSTSSSPSHRPKSPKRSPSGRLSRSMSGHFDPVKYVSVMAENEELTAAVAEKETALQQMNQQQAKLQRKLAKYQQRLQHLGYMHREANEQLQQSALKQRVTKEMLALSMQLVKTTAQRVTAQVPPSTEVLQEVQPILAAEGLLDVDSSEPRNAVKASQREAILAAASVDFSGHFGQRWAASTPGESSTLIKLLERFEQALQVKLSDGSAVDMLRPMRYAVPSQVSQPPPALPMVAEEFISPGGNGGYGSAQSVVSMSSNASMPKVPVAPRTGSPVSSLGGSSPSQSARFRKTTKSRENNMSQRGMSGSQ